MKNEEEIETFGMIGREKGERWVTGREKGERRVTEREKGDRERQG